MPKIDIEIKNGDNNDNFVTVRDRNRAGSPIVWDQNRLNGGTSGLCSLEADGSGLTKCQWTATRTDDQTETRTEDDEAYQGNIIFVTSH